MIVHVNLQGSKEFDDSTCKGTICSLPGARCVRDLPADAPVPRLPRGPEGCFFLGGDQTLDAVLIFLFWKAFLLYVMQNSGLNRA